MLPRVRVIFENVSAACLTRKRRYGNVPSKMKASHRHLIVFFGTRRDLEPVHAKVRSCAGFRTPAVTSPQRARAAGVRKAPRHEIAGSRGTVSAAGSMGIWSRRQLIEVGSRRLPPIALPRGMGLGDGPNERSGGCRTGLAVSIAGRFIDVR